MSKNVSIKEGDRARNFGPTAKIKTDLQAGGSCYWVPENERETGHIFASENREYTPDEIDKYGIDSIDVNIIFTGTTIDGDPWSVTIDPDTGLPIIDIDDVEITIDDVTGDIDISTPDIDTTIDDADLDDFGIDPDADIDISIDDLGNVEISDGDISIDFDPETGEWDTGDCPASIRIMHVPNKTEYTDGTAIDYDGLVVQAFDKEGNLWTSNEYPDGYIPVHKLLLDTKYADIEQSDARLDIPDYDVLDSFSDIATVADPGNVCDILTDKFPVSEWAERSQQNLKDGLAQMRLAFQSAVSEAHGIVSYAWCGEPPQPNVSTMIGSGWCGVVSVVGPPNSSGYCSAVIDQWGCISQYDGVFYLWFHERRNTQYPLFEGVNPQGVYSSINAEIKSGHMAAGVSWFTPCMEQISSSFEITVNKREDHGGSHHSGKF